MREIEDELENLGVRVAVVTFEAGLLARAYVEDTGLTWPLLVDEDRGLYRAFDMLEASAWDVWGPRTWWAYLRALAAGQRLHASEGDVNQRGGDVLIDPSGIVRLCHVGPGPADRPEVSALLEVVKGERRARAS